MSHLPDRVRALRQERGMTVERLAFSSGLSVSTVMRVETGKHDPSLTTVEAIAKGLDLTASDLLADPAPASSSGEGVES